MYRVLIADDEPYIRDRVTHHMPWGEVGFEVAGCVGNGSQALDLFGSLKPHALLTDIRMPGITGLELTQTIREREPRTKVIVMSAYDDFKYAQQAIRLGVKGYLLKPIIREEFVELLRTVADELRDESLAEGGRTSTLEAAEPSSLPGTTAVSRIEKKPSHPYMVTAKRFIDEHFEEKLRLEDVADVLYMNPNYFSSLFKREMGLSFVDYVNELRIRKAMELLRSTDYKIYEVSIRVGCGNFSYFNKLFKRINGITPQAYRELARGKRDNEREERL